MDATPSFTAARIAAVLGRDKSGVCRALKPIAPHTKVAMAGGLANAWTVESLPEHYRVELARLAKVKGCRDVTHLLADGVARWTPGAPLSELDQRHIDKAVRVKNALARAIALYAGEPLEAASALRVAHQDYQKEFGQGSERHVRRILDRVIDRDAGEERFDDLALYLDDNISRAKGKEAILPGLLDPGHQAVFVYLGGVKRPGQPTVQETDLIWFAACEAIQLQVEQGMREKKARRAMVDFLDRSAVSLSKNTTALKALLKWKLARYQECGRVFDLFIDQRPEKSGKHAEEKPLDEESRLLLIANASQNHSGRIAPAYRELRNADKFGPTFERKYIANPSRKSYVPQSIRDDVKHEILRQENIVHGEKRHRAQGAHIIRDWSGCPSGEYYGADDITMPIYWWDELENGPAAIRGQLLMMHDVRSDYILGFILIPKAGYDSLAIRSLITVCAARHGLPRRGFAFENGIWKKAKIISGSRFAPSFEHFDTGLRRLGMTITHAREARGKPIERTIGLIQNRCEKLPGYVGRDEVSDERERVQRDLDDVRAGRKAIDKCFLSKMAFCRVLAEIIEDHNNEAQEGSRLSGMTPAEGWEAFQGNVQRQGFSNDWRFVLASDNRKLKIGRNGLVLPYGRRRFHYRDAETGKREGEVVQTWFDPMMPETLLCTDLNNKNPFVVERAHEVPAFNATEEELGDEMRHIDGHQSHAKNVYYASKNILKKHNFAPTVADIETVQIGEVLAAGRTRIAARQDETRRRVRANSSLIDKHGLRRELINAPTDVVESIKKLRDESQAEETL